MFVSESFLEIAYELTIFLLFILFFAHCFKKFLLPFVEQRFQEIKQYWNELRAQKNLLKKTLDSVEEKAEDQKIYLAHLEKKIKRWNLAAYGDLAVKKENLEKHIKKLVAKKKQQNKTFHEERLQQEVLPSAVQKAHEKFEEYYKKAEGKELLSTLLKRLKQTTHNPKAS